MSTSPQKRNRSQRVAAIEVQYGGLWAEFVRLRQQGLWPRLGVVVLAVLLLTLVSEPWLEPFPYRTGWIPRRDILATTAFSVIDEEETRRLQDQAAAQTLYVFSHSPEQLLHVRDELNGLLRQLSTVDVMPLWWRDFLPDAGPGSAQTEEELRTSFERFREGFKDPNTLGNLQQAVDRALAWYETRGILDPQTLPKPKSKVEERQRRDEIRVHPQDHPGDPETWPRVPVSEVDLGDGHKLADRLSAEATMISAADHLFHWLYRKLKPISTLKYDGDATQAEREKARGAVAPVENEYQVGMVLASHDEPIDEPRLALLRKEYEAREADDRLADQFQRAGLWLVVVASMIGLLWYYLIWLDPKFWSSLPSLTAALGMLVGGVAWARLMSVDAIRGELLPIVFFSMIFAIAYRKEVALLLALTLASFTVLTLGQSSDQLIVAAGGAAAAVAVSGRVRSRTKLIKVGFFAASVVFVLTVIVYLLEGQPLKTAVEQGAWQFAHVFFAGFLMSGALPFLEGTFLLTDIKLLELGDVTHPLLQELVRRAPGTYNHSINVAAIAEAAAEAIECNGLLVRVGAYFHDIGKMLKPDYFVENQTPDQNRHNALVPQMSALIIIAHVKDGADLARQHGLPEAIIDFIEQHHGTTLVKYFYDRASRYEELNPSGCRVDETTFRYPGPKPQTKEAAVMMLADAVESASRTLAEPTATRIRNLVHSIAIARLMDGQFDECGLNLKELKAVEDSLVKSLIAVYHGRVKYQDEPSTKSIPLAPEKAAV